ncbi:type VI secretion system baseplate subunit TssF [Inquilinus sp. CA228]|uniref:type VI secretion system baseplate subunit TssF n=1 Tax=Inquilinus sp. CA228 TaxID=3455609 RepID=UPI003F8D26C0
MSIHRYYEDELAYLHDLGDAFGKANPAIAGLLSRRASDPDVERLLEGFAFLTGRLRQRLDEELPELSHGLLALLWPHFLRPIPALSILEFTPPASGAVMQVPSGAPVESRPVEGTACRFRTCFGLDLLPFAIDRATLEETAASAVLTLTVAPRGGAAPALLAGRRLRVFLHGGRSASLGQRLLRTMLTDLTAIEAGPERQPLPLSGLGHAGLGAEEGVLPWPGNAFPGYRILQEYLAFPERFLFVDLPPIPAEALTGATLDLRFLIGRKPDLPGRIGPENFRLNCTPVINLYATEAVPFAPDPSRLEHRLVPEWPAGRFARVYSVDRVEGAVQGRGDRVVFPAFESFDHALPGRVTRFYRARRRPAVIDRGTEVWLAFVDGMDQPAMPAADTISVTVTCTDGDLAELVPIGGIDQVAVGSPASGGFSNITPVRPEAAPPLHGDTLWRLVSGLARSLRPLDDIASLTALIAGYDFRAVQDEQARRRLELLLGGLKSLQVEPMEALVGAIPVRGRRVTLTVAESGLGGPEGAFLFGAVFDAFIGILAELNTCYRLVVHGSETNTTFRWPLRAGRGPVL